MKLKTLLTVCTIVFLLGCNPLKKLTNQVNSNLPTELKKRFYNENFVGTFIENPKDVLGKLVYIYRINDSTFSYITSVLRYPRNLGVIEGSEKPVLRASGVIEIKNTNDFGLFLSAFNLNSITSSSDAAEIVVIDNRHVAINGDTIQYYFENKPILPLERLKIGNTTYQPEIIYYVRGVHITSVSAKSAKSFTSGGDASGAFFKMNNKYYSSGTGFTFDYKAGLTVEDVTSYVKSGGTNNETPKKGEPENLNVNDSLLKNTPLNKIKSIKIKRID